MLRALSTTESFYFDQHINIVTVCDFEGKINALILQKALEIVVNSHPLLCSEIQKAEHGYDFVKREAYADKITVVGGVDKDKRKKIILSELNKPLTNTSLIRCILLLEERIGILKSQHMTFITTTHHAVSDGISCMALQEEIWQVYSELASHGDPVAKTYDLMPALEDITPKQFSDAELSDYITRYNSAVNEVSAYTVPIKEASDEPMELSYVSTKLTSKQTKAFLDHCKENTVSAHGAICAANLLALRDLFAENGHLHLSCHSPINIRPRLEPAIDKHAMFSAAVGCLYQEDVSAEMKLWELGEKIAKSIQDHIDSGDVFKSIQTYDETRMKSKGGTSIGVTNIGLVDITQKYHKLKLISVNFIPRIPLPMLAVSAATSDNKLTLTYPYSKSFYSTRVIKKIAETAAKYIIAI